MNEEHLQFDDPELKAALRRVCAGERAPGSLRERVIGLTGAAASPALKLTSPVTRRPFWSSPIFRLAAAVFVIASIGLYYTLHTRPDSIDEHTLLAMIKTHDYCCNMPNHSNPSVPQSSFASMGTAMSLRLHEPVLAADLKPDGWTFHGANYCPVDGNTSAHLTFWRGAQRLSIFSLPAASCKYAKDGSSYSESLNGHLIAGFVESGAVHCMVGQCPAGQLKLQDVAALLKKHQNDLVTSAVAIAGRGELLRRLR